MRAINPIFGIVPIPLRPFLTFDSDLRTFYWIDDEAANPLAGRENLKLIISLINERQERTDYTIDLTILAALVV